MGSHFVSVMALTALGFGLLPARVSAQGDRKAEAAVLQRALDDFKVALDERWSYRHANRADFDAAIDALRRRVAAGLSTDEFGLELHKILTGGCSIDMASARTSWWILHRRARQCLNGGPEAIGRSMKRRLERV